MAEQAKFELSSDNCSQSVLLNQLQDKDAFLVKIPHKLKDYLNDPKTFSLTAKDAYIGKIVDTSGMKKWPGEPSSKKVNPEQNSFGSVGPNRPSIDELLQPEKTNSSAENAADDGAVECLMRLDLPRKRRNVTEEVFFDIAFPDLGKARAIAQNQNLYAFELDMQSDINRTKARGQLKYRILGEAQLRPKELRDQDLINLDRLSEQEVEKRLKTEDSKRDSIKIETILDPIAPPPIIPQDDAKEAKDKRVAMPEELLKKNIIDLFAEKRNWKVEEVASRLNQPRQPVKSMMENLCSYDKIRKYYILKAVYQSAVQQQ